MKQKVLNKRTGFTLVEIIAVLVILVAIALIIGVNLNRLSNRQNEENYEVFKNNIISATDIYLNQHTTRLNDLFVNRGYIIVTIGDLKTAGLIEDDLINPETGDRVGNNEQIKVSLDAAGLIQYEFPINPDQINEEYLQALNVYLELGETVNCRTFRPGNNFELALVSATGTLNMDLDSFSFSCDWGNPNNNLDTNDSRRNTVGTHIVTYTYQTSAGVQKTTTRNFIVMPKLTVNLTGIPNPSGYASTGSTPNSPIQHMDLASGSERYAWHNQTSITMGAEANRHANVNYTWTRYNTLTCTGASACTTSILSTSNTLPTEHVIEGINLYRLDYEVRMYNTNGTVSYRGFELFLIRVDRSSPTCATSTTHPNWTNQTVTITGTCNDPLNGNQTTASGCRNPNITRNFTGTAGGIFNANESPGTVTDVAGNTVTCPVINIRIDRNPPTCSTTSTNSNWTNSSVTITGTCADQSNGSGCLASTVTRNFTGTAGGIFNANESPGTVTDRAGNITTCPTSNVRIDRNPPTCSTTSTNSNWTNSSVTITGTCADQSNGSGCLSSTVTRNFTGTAGGIFNANESPGTVADRAGNIATCPTSNVRIDRERPTCGSITGASTSWSNSNRNITVTCNDGNGSGCTRTSYNNNFTTQMTTGTITIGDNVGNTQTCTVNVYLDRTAPSCSTSNCSDSGGSGLAATEYCTTTGSSSNCSWSSNSSRLDPTTCNTTNYYYIRGRDNAGNQSTPVSRGSRTKSCSCPSGGYAGSNYCSYSYNSYSGYCECSVSTWGQCNASGTSIGSWASWACGSSGCFGKCNCSCPNGGTTANVTYSTTASTCTAGQTRSASGVCRVSRTETVTGSLS